MEPAKIPKPVISAHFKPPPEASKLGIIREKEVAASITPAANPSKLSNIFSEIFLVKNIGIAPIPVIRPATVLASIPNIKVFSNIFIIKPPFILSIRMYIS